MPEMDLGPGYFNVISFVNENLIFPQPFSELDMHSQIMF